ncbi:unnamed protein product [Anisakis simplex]|uniref:DNA_mis_repair domain-containing protein n=1 Tax=Anisakis simplex TaxID=6269 RepID=A0A0M3K6A8_ANISI|nr:unnamed protein product [Anisakis simplex]
MSEKENNRTIEKIPEDVCRRICTGQVVSTLSSACKELIDNALDAGANTLGEFIDYCLIADCKAHATSKLNDITDFSRLSTFGFRGEALHALCAISSVVVTTRHIDETMATRMVFDHNGCIVSRESCARPAGTTVVVSNLFETLPVRRKELQRTAKKEFCKLLNVVQTFALSRTDIRFSIASTSNGKRQQVLSTPGGNATIKDVLVTLFGARSNKNAVLDIVQRLPNDQICILYGVDAEKSVPIFAEIKLSGYVSSCVHGHGRSSNDRQFIYFNRRPVHYPKLCRVANEVYQQYNQGYYCMLVLFVEVPPAMTSSNDHSLNECTANVDSISVTSECDKLVEASKDGRTATLNDILHSTAVIPHHHGKNEGQPQTMVDGTRKRGAAKVLESFAFKVITHERKTDDDDTMLTAVKRNKPAAEVIDDFVANTANEDDLDESSSNTTLVRDRNASVPTTNPRVVTLLDGYQNHQSKMAPINIGQLHQISGFSSD